MLDGIQEGHGHRDHEQDIRPFLGRNVLDDPLGLPEFPQEGAGGSCGIEWGPQEHRPAMVQGEKEHIVVTLLDEIAHTVAAYWMSEPTNRKFNGTTTAPSLMTP